jgi:hypothetical protein
MTTSFRYHIAYHFHIELLISISHYLSFWYNAYYFDITLLIMFISNYLFWYHITYHFDTILTISISHYLSCSYRITYFDITLLIMTLLIFISLIIPIITSLKFFASNYLSFRYNATHRFDITLIIILIPNYHFDIALLILISHYSSDI